MEQPDASSERSPVPPAGGMVPLRCGPVELYFDPQDGGLRTIRVGGREALQRLYFAIRDPDWNTAPSDLRNLQTTEIDLLDPQGRSGQAGTGWRWARWNR